MADIAVFVSYTPFPECPGIVLSVPHILVTFVPCFFNAGSHVAQASTSPKNWP